MMATKVWLIALLFSFSAASFAQSDAKPAKIKKPAKQSSDYVIDSKPTAPPPWNQKNQSSEIFHQAAGETFEVSAMVGFASLKFNYNSSAAPKTSAQVTSVVGGVIGEYGFNEKFR